MPVSVPDPSARVPGIRRAAHETSQGVCVRSLDHVPQHIDQRLDLLLQMGILRQGEIADLCAPAAETSFGTAQVSLPTVGHIPIVLAPRPSLQHANLAVRCSTINCTMSSNYGYFTGVKQAAAIEIRLRCFLETRSPDEADRQPHQDICSFQSSH